MPVGVPKIPFLIPGDEEPTWVDLYNGLYRRRLLFLCQEVDYEISNQLIGLMTFLNIEDPTQEQFLFISSPGGGIIPGAGVFDTMQSVRADINTICLGVAASMASFILVGGTVTKRIAFPHARVMIHQPASSFFESQTGEFVMELDLILELRDYIERVYVQRTGQPRWVIHRDLERDIFMSATEAKKYGIIDEIGIHTTKLGDRFVCPEEE
uniref:ATP-dependent Clp protease proteolytic subunit n=1 Tax=Ligustrum vulgare TaxID=13597 RepID=A0A4D5Y0Z4_LIGVU|nr:ATP-dependent Clp protease proteolytic subunit [Ligustrum vulgare]QBS49463.1 ATP-dependent Clp protease proteolytic subunit [Ligustrum vulgare]